MPSLQTKVLLSVVAHQHQQVVQGPQEAFVEALRQNTACAQDYYSKAMPKCFRSVPIKANIAVMYLNDLANLIWCGSQKTISMINSDFIADTECWRNLSRIILSLVPNA